MGVNQGHEGDAHRAGDHQPRADDRQHRPARHRRQLHHRSVQRDGLAAVQQHHEPARRPRLRQPGAARRGRRPILGIPVDRIPDRASLAYDQIIDGIRDGKIKGLWVIATNTAHSWIYQDTVRDAFDKLDFLVVQDMYPTTETAQHADLYLPAAGWGEKEGTFINSERRVGIIKRVAQAPGQALGRLRDLPADRRRMGLRRHVRASGRRPKPCSGSSNGSRAVGPAT